MARKSKYTTGQHGAKKKEQQRLSNKYKTKISGKTHESEHAIGFEPLNRTSNIKRGKSKEIKNLENKAPAYQEEKKFHRSHIGTGNKKTKDESGFTSQGYRDAQRKLIEDKDVSSAMQLNQLGYAFLKGFQKDGDSGSPDEAAANDSYKHMIEKNTKLNYRKNEKEIDVNITPLEQAEMFLAREAAKTGQWPTQKRIDEVKKKFGIK